MNASADAAALPANAGGPHGAMWSAMGTAVVVLSVMGLGLSEHGLALAPGLPPWFALLGLVALAAMTMTAWTVGSQRPHAAAGLSIVLAAVALPAWSSWDWLPVGLAAGLHAAGPMAVPGAMHVGLGWAFEARHSRALTVAYALGGVAAAIIAVGYDPLADPACAFTCADADPLAETISTRTAVLATFALLLACAAVATRAFSLAPRIPLVLRRSAEASIGLLVLGWGIHGLLWTDSVPAVTFAVPGVGAVIFLSGGVFGSWWSSRRSRLAAERLIAELQRPHIADLAGHGALDVQFAVPDEDRWVTIDGQPAPDLSPVHHVVILTDGGLPAVRLELAPGSPAPGLETASPRTKVALANARLAAVTRARLEDTAESRRRIVQASEAERRRIERDLHDGAQQRLISAALHISVASSQLPPASARRVQSSISEALAHLRDLAHGLARPGRAASDD